MDPQEGRKFISTLSFGQKAGDLEKAEERTRAVIECAEENGLQLLDGHTTNSRERDAFESVSYGTDGIWRNAKAERGEFEETPTGTPVPAGTPGA